MSNDKIITSTMGETKGVRYIRGGRCWAKITKFPGHYKVACGWNGDYQATRSAVTTKTLSHARIIADGWINDYGW